MATSPRKKKSEWDRLVDRSATLRRGLQDLGEELRRMCDSDGRDAIRGAGVVRQELERWGQAIGSLAPAGQDLLGRLERERDDQSGNLDQRIQRELATRGHVVVGDGSVLVVDGFVHLEMDTTNGTVRVNGHTSGGTAPGLVADAVSTEAGRLRGLLTRPSTMLEQLHTAYARELAVRGKNPGTQIETGALVLQLVILRQDAGFRSNASSANFREYPRELFRADLYELLSSGVLEIGGQRLRFASGSDTRGAIFMLVPALGRCAHVGRMWFEPTPGER